MSQVNIRRSSHLIPPSIIGKTLSNNSARKVEVEETKTISVIPGLSCAQKEVEVD